MSDRDDDGHDNGGQAPCFAPLLEERPGVTDALLAQVAAELADGLVIADNEGRITFWNDAATRLFGYSDTEAIGQTLDLIIPERLRERHWTGHRNVMITGRTSYGDRLLAVPAVRRDGRRLSIAFTVTLLRAPGSQ